MAFAFSYSFTGTEMYKTSRNINETPCVHVYVFLFAQKVLNPLRILCMRALLLHAEQEHLLEKIFTNVKV